MIIKSHTMLKTLIEFHTLIGEYFNLNPSFLNNLSKNT
jgi:hypothetical protein